jgi:raffinose/stachyose/melibiose transport system substrate-binding protein
MMRRMFLVVLCSFFAVGMAVAAGQKEAKSAKIVLNVAGIFVDDLKPWEEIVAMYKEKFPNVEIKWTNMNNDDYQRGGLTSLFAAGTPPDVYWNFGGDRQVARYIEAGQAMGLMATLAAEKNWEGNKVWKDSFLPSALTSGRMEAEEKDLYLLPIDINYVCAWYNADVFNKVGVKAPTTFTELFQICQKIKDAGIIPIVFGNKGRWQGGHWFGTMIERVAGKKAFDELRLTRRAYTDPDILRAFELLEKFVKAGFIVEGVNTITQEDGWPLIWAGKAAIEASSGSWNIPNWDEQGIAYDLFKQPKDENGKGDWRVEMSNKAGFMLYPKTTYKAEAIGFLKAVSSMAAEKIHVQIRGQLPVLLGSDSFIVNPKMLKFIREISVPATDTIIFPEDGFAPDVDAIFQDALEAMLDGKPAKEVTAAAQKRVEALK